MTKIKVVSTLHGGQGILQSTDAGQTWRDFYHAHSYKTRCFILGNTPGSVIYHMFGNMARTVKLYE